MMGRGFNGIRGVSQYGVAFGPWMIIAMLIKLIIFLAIIFIAYKIIKKYNFHSISAMRILDERYAKGEIEEEDYLKRKEVLRRK